ncbi:MAG TPA: VOC family protein [Solirubrobacterales bacterium]|nr:VOC family protein [Solirubrobacterales bacterium]
MFTETKAFSSYAVDDIERAKEFYEGMLGLTTSSPMEEMLLSLEIAAGQSVMLYLKPDFVAATYTVLNFTVDDLEATVDELTTRGIEFERYEGMGQDEKGVSREGGGPPIAWFKDPAGNILSVLTP